MAADPQHPSNALANSSSAYLRSAMHQPVQWREWSAEAFETAKRENKPILLDIGAVWCHWCHVMDRESYENPEVARIINDQFVAVKVDRDERPDVDSRYQSAVQAISGQGGWPLTGFLTPEGKPFFGGTYFPPDDRWGRMGFRRVLLAVAQAFREKRDEVTESAESVMAAISHQEAFAGRATDVNPKTIDRIVESAVTMFDRHYGGFGSAPKFPHSSATDLLIDAYARTHSEILQEVVTTTLAGMAKGGVYDQLAGGFHRYSVDEKWRVPHFEKMSYDNSELLKNYVHAAQVLQNPFFAAVARDIIRWTDEWLSDAERGGFYASQDADISLDDDGDYFTWTREEAEAVLDGEEFKAAAAYFDIGEVGEMHHNPKKNVLWVAREIDGLARELKKTEQETVALLAHAKQKMSAARLQRPTPYIDKTVYTGWNSMMISAYLQAASALSETDAGQFALKSLDRLLSEAWDPQTKHMRHVIAYSDPAAVHREVAGTLDDYVFAAIACLDAYEFTGDVQNFFAARAICDSMLARFFDPVGGGFFDTDGSAGPMQLLGALHARRKPLQDSPTPAGNSAAAIALVRLFHLTNEAKYRDAAEETLEAFAGVADQFGIFIGAYGVALRMFSAPHTQVVVIGEDSRADELYAEAVKDFSLSKNVLRLRGTQIEKRELPPALAETIPHFPGIKNGGSMAVICREFTCEAPISDPEQLAARLKQLMNVQP